MIAALSEEVVEKVNAKRQIYFLIMTVSNYQEDTFMFAKERVLNEIFSTRQMHPQYLWGICFIPLLEFFC